MAARSSGVRVVVQEPEIIPHVSVSENVYAGALPRRGRIFDRAGLHAQVTRDLARYGFTQVIRPEQLGRSLSPAQRQIVEILRALTGGARIIAFDEPTSSLSDHEVESLFRLIGQLTAEGIAVIYVSHRMKEIFRVATRILVLRDGASVGERLAAETSEAELVRMMVGRDLSALFARSARRLGPVMLRLRGVTTADVTDISFGRARWWRSPGSSAQGGRNSPMPSSAIRPSPRARWRSRRSRCACAPRAMRCGRASPSRRRSASSRRC
jgi:ABC-type sugar transport system ATPase subunit